MVSFGIIHDDPTSFVASQTQLGILAAFTEFNRATSVAAVCPPVLELLSTPSAGSADANANASVQASSLLASGVVGFLGCTGSNATQTLAQISSRKGVPLFGPGRATEAEALRWPFVPNVFVLGGLPSDQGIAIVQELRVRQGLQLLVLFQELGFAPPGAVEAIALACSSTGLPLLAIVSCNSSNGSNGSAALGEALRQAQPFVPEAFIVLAGEGIAAQLVLAVRQSPLLGAARVGVLSVADVQGFSAVLAGDTTGLLLSQVWFFADVEVSRGQTCF